MTTSKNKNIGFTLIELLTVIVIIAILVTIAIPSFQTYLAKGKAAEAFTALEEYKIRTAKVAMLNGTAPDSSWVNSILFPDNDMTEQVVGQPNNKTVVNYNYVNQVSAYIIGTAPNTSVLLGARLNTSGLITATNNYVYIAYIANSNGTGYQWVCGTSASRTNNVTASLLPTNCNQILP